MDGGAHILLTISGLVLVALGAAAAGERLGAPLLLIFLAVGVLAGPEGPGGLILDDPDTAFTAASAALAVILVDGGLRTRPEALSLAWRPGLALAFFGTVLTAGLTGLAAHAAFGLGWRESALIGAIVSSTDAAAVFALIGGAGAKVRARLAATLEVESGVNDPVAVFLTVTLAGSLAQVEPTGPVAFLTTLAWQALGGLLIGVAAGRGLALVTPRLRLAPGLRPILILAVGLFAFALAQSVSASGFLAAYVCGIAHARRDRGVVEAEARALDGFAWLAQLLLFLTLGLLVTPSHVVAVAAPALAIALALTLAARPIAVFLTLAPFRFSRNEQLFAAWAGLRGATPIFLGLAPAALGTPNANLYFSVAFMVVCVSLVAQGWTTGAAARLFGVAGEGVETPGVRIDLLRGGAVAAAIVAAVTSAMVIARVATPPPALTLTPADIDELEAAISRPGGAIVTAFPPDWADMEDQERRRELFAATLAPLVEAQNTLVAAERADLRSFREDVALGEPLSLPAQARRDVLARAYGVRYDQLDELSKRVDTVPVRLAIAQAAVVTGWGTSEAAREANALFGRLPRGEGEGAAAAASTRRFDSLAASVADYINTLNTHPAFAEFREARAQARAEGREPTAEELAPYIAPFAADGAGFAAAVARALEGLPAAEPEAEGAEP